MDEKQLAEWRALGDRLAIAAPEEFRAVLTHVRRITEQQEVIARTCPPASLDGRRPTMRYRA